MLVPLITLASLACPADAQGQSLQRSALNPQTKDTLIRLEGRLQHTPRILLRRRSSSWARVSYLGGFELPTVGAIPDERARDFLTQYGQILGVTTDHQLSGMGTRPWAGGHVVRYGVKLGGLPVFGHSVAVSVQGDHVTAASGGLWASHQIDSPRPVLGPAGIYREVLAQTGTSIHRVLELGYLLRGDSAVLVWRADQYRGPESRRWVLVVDATTGAVISAGPGQREALGTVYDPSPAVAPSPTQVTLPHLTSADALVGTYAAAYQCDGPSGDTTGEPPCSEHHQGASPDAAGNYLLAPMEPSLSDGFAQVQAYYHVSRFNRWLEDRFAFAWRCNGSRRVDVFVNWDYANAYYGDADGDACPDITLGESGLDFAYDADVIYHELGHGLVSQTAALGCEAVGVCLDDLGINWIPHGLAEGFADYFSMTFTGSPDLGEHVGQLIGASYIRTASNDAVCPWDLTSEPHQDGHILMGAAWELRQALGAQRTDDLLYGALLTLPQDAEYGEAAAALEQAAADLEAAGRLNATEVSTVRQVIGPSGRNMAGCRRVIPLDNRPADKPVALAYGSPTLPGTLDELPLGLQFTLNAPVGALKMSVSIEARYELGSAWRVYLRRDHPVQMALGVSGVEVTADHTFGDSPSTVHLTVGSSPALVPGGVYHVALVYAAPQSELFAITGSVEVDPSIKPDAGGSETSPGSDAGAIAETTVSPQDYPADALTARDGCGCRTANPTPDGSLLLILALLLWTLRRTPRRTG